MNTSESNIEASTVRSQERVGNTGPHTEANGKKILHICEVSVFLKLAVEYFEKYYKGRNLFLVNSEMVLHGHIDCTNLPSTKCVAYSSTEYKDYLRDPETNYFLVIFHNIGPPYKKEIADLIFHKVPIHGILWGFELFNNVKLDGINYLKETRRYIRKSQAKPSKGLRSRVRDIYNFYTKPVSYWNRHWGVFDRLESYSTILNSERVFTEKFYRTKKKYFPFNYSGGYKINDSDQLRNGKSILVGNSASLSNNHIDILKYLKKLEIHPGAKIVLPLSYGDEEYADFVANAYRELFDDKVLVLREFTSFEDYNKIIASCGFVIMNHIRQQAMGNVFLGLLQGAKVFLNGNSFGFKELSAKNLKIYEINEILEEYPFQETRENVDYNQAIIHKIRGEEAMAANLCRIVDAYLE